MKTLSFYTLGLALLGMTVFSTGCSTEDDEIGRGSINFTAVGKLSELPREGIQFTVYRSKELAEEGNTPEKPAVTSDENGKASVIELLAGRTYWYKAENPKDNWNVISETPEITAGDNNITVEVI